MYRPHPSRVLSALFSRKPYQGASPDAASFLFVGLDANYAADIECSPIFAELLAYHEDGSAFWRRHGVHHPFLLTQYQGDGRRYHRTFARIGFRPEHADLVSFIELLHLPTVGRSLLEPGDLASTHLKALNKFIFEGGAKFIFISAGVARLMRSTGLFPKLGQPVPASSALRVMHQDADRTVFMHLHFSNYGRFEMQLQAEAKEIAALIDSRVA